MEIKTFSPETKNSILENLNRTLSLKKDIEIHIPGAMAAETESNLSYEENERGIEILSEGKSLPYSCSIAFGDEVIFLENGSLGVLILKPKPKSEGFERHGILLSPYLD